MPFANYFIIPFLLDATIAANFLVINLYAQDLGATALDLGTMRFVWGCTYATSSLTVGRLADRLPRRGVMTAAIGCFALAVASAQFARAPWHLYVALGANGAGCACFWPLFATLLHDSDPKAHSRKTTCFNVGWTAGLAVGSAAGGFLKEAGAVTAINTLAAVAAVLAIYFQWSTRRGLPTARVAATTSVAEVEPRTPHKPHYLWMAWLANCAIFAGASIVSSLFPKLARELNYRPGAIGLVHALIVVSQALTFLYVCRCVWWRHRLVPLVAAQVLAIAGLVLVATGSRCAVFALAMVGIGVGRAMTYASSLDYGLLDPDNRSRNMGIHEMLIGVAVAVGALLGGVTGNCVSLRAAFWVAAGLVGAAVLAQLAISWHHRGARDGADR